MGKRRHDSSASSGSESSNDDARGRRRERKQRNSSSRASRDDGEQRRSSKRRDERKHKKHKKHRKHRQSTERAPEADFAAAMVVVRELLSEFPEIAGDLLMLLQMVDDGQAAVIGGIDNRRVRDKLKELFPLLGLVKLREPKGAYSKPKSAANEPLLEVFQRLLTGDSEPTKNRRDGKGEGVVEVETNEEKSSRPAGTSQTSERAAVIGPARPPPGALPDTSTNADAVEDSDDDDVVGPALPGMRGFRLADERVEAEMARQAQALEKEEWDRARGITKPDNSIAAPMAREEWMTVVPDSSFLKDSLGPTAKRQAPGKSAAFRSKEPAAMDKTWFDTPEERERAKRAKLDIQLLGYVREENAPVAGPSMPGGPRGAAVNESIVPSANPEADSNIRRQMEQMKQSRGPSLLEQHQKKVAEEAKAKGITAIKPSGWNRERDLTARRGMSQDDADRIINASRQINSKFTAPTISRQFL